MFPRCMTCQKSRLLGCDCVLSPCCFCGILIHKLASHNAQPLKDGRCCYLCNWDIVLPVRIGAIGGIE